MVTKILNIVMELSKLDDIDAFFDFSGHTNSLHILVYSKCNYDTMKNYEESIAFQNRHIRIKEEQELKETFNKLAELYGELKASK